MFLLLIFSAIGLIKCNEFTYSDCTAGDQYIRISDIAVNPHPILYPKNVDLSLNLDILKDIPVNAKTKITARKTSPKAIQVPCMFGYGSCTHSYCELWKEMTGMSSEIAPGGCPLSVGRYSVQNSTILMPKSNVIKFFKSILKGDYSVDLTFFNDSTKEVYGCTQVKFTIDFDSAFKWSPNIDERLDQKLSKKSK